MFVRTPGSFIRLAESFIASQFIVLRTVLFVLRVFVGRILCFSGEKSPATICSVDFLPF